MKKDYDSTRIYRNTHKKRVRHRLMTHPPWGESGAPFGKGDGGIRKILIDFIKVANHKVIIHQLPQPNPLIHQMREDMS